MAAGHSPSEFMENPASFMFWGLTFCTGAHFFMGPLGLDVLAHMGGEKITEFFGGTLLDGLGFDFSEAAHGAGCSHGVGEAVAHVGCEHGVEEAAVHAGCDHASEFAHAAGHEGCAHFDHETANHFDMNCAQPVVPHFD